MTVTARMRSSCSPRGCRSPGSLRLIGFLLVLASWSPPLAHAGPGLQIQAASGYLAGWDGNDGDYYSSGDPAPVPDNLATGSVAFASSEYGTTFGLPYHRTFNLNDGSYGNSKSWLGTGSGDFAGVSFDSPREITAIAFGRDNGISGLNGEPSSPYDDRWAGTYTVQNTADGVQWTTIFTATLATHEDFVVGGAFTGYLRHQFSVATNAGQPIASRGIRVHVPAGAAIDELEVYGNAIGPVAVRIEPGDATRVIGQQATFRAIFDGSPPIAVQWRKNGVDIPGAIGSSYTTPPLTVPDQGSTYSAHATNQNGTSTVSTRQARLTVLASHPEPLRTGGFQFNKRPDPLFLDSGKRNHLFYVGEPVSFSMTGSPVPLNYEVRDYYGIAVAAAPIAPGQGSVQLPVTQPGWYKLYVFGTPISATWGDVLGSTTFAILRNNPNFPLRPPAGTPGGGAESFTGDEILRGLTGLGPQRHSVPDAGNPAQAIAQLGFDIQLDEQYYLPFDPERNRKLLMAFPNGVSESQTAGLAAIVDHFKDSVTYFEPRNEPNFFIAPSTFAQGEMKRFYETVKGVDPSLKVLGPGTVTIGPGSHGLGYIEDFLRAGGAAYIDGLSFHAYNNLNGDLWLARKSMDELVSLLGKYGVEKEIWQTEQGSFAAVYGAYQPRLQGRWTMLQMMVYEQYGLPKERNHLWYDVSHGFWSFPTWIVNDDGGLNPAAALMRVWSEELYGTNHSHALDFGPLGNDIYVGSVFEGPGKAVAALMSAGRTDGIVELAVAGGDGALGISSPFGVESVVPVVNGRALIPVTELPSYVRLNPGESVSVSVPEADRFTNLARMPGVTVLSSGSANANAAAGKLVNGVLDNWYYTHQADSAPFMDDTPAFPAWVEILLPAAQSVSRVVVFASPPWQGQSSLLDFEIQADNNGDWLTLGRIVEEPKTFGAYGYATNTTVDSFYSDRWIFDHAFPPVTTSKIRLLVHGTTYGGGATLLVQEAGGQTGANKIVLREVQIFPSSAVPPAAPVRPTATGADHRADLRWETASGAATYTLRRATASGGPYNVLAEGLTRPSYSDLTVTNGVRYYYVVSAVNPMGESALSSEFAVTPDPGLRIQAASGYLAGWDGNDGYHFSPGDPAPVPDNLAIGALAFASSEYGTTFGLPYHRSFNLNDGSYGNLRSWLGTGSGDFAGVSFASTREITGIAFGRDNGISGVNGEPAPPYDDRWAGTYTVQSTADGVNWTTVFTVTLTAHEDQVVGGAFTGYLRHQFSVSTDAGNPIASRGIRVTVPAGAAIDELEIYEQAAEPDSDGDGLPDAYELATFGDLESQSGGDDADHDGAINLEEFQTGTNPADPSSFFRLSGALVGETMILTWTSVPGKTYRILTSMTLGTPNSWVDLGINVPASPNATTSTTLDLTAFGGSRLFARVAVKLE